MAKSPSRPKPTRPAARNYSHTASDAVARPPIGVAPRFTTKKPPSKYRYDSSLSPALDWDTNPAREMASFLLQAIEDAARLPAPHLFAERRTLLGADGAPLLQIAGLQDALASLKRMQAPFLDWTGKAERLSFEVPSLPLFVHERLSTKAIIESLRAHEKFADQASMFDLFGDPQRPLTENIRAYEYRDRWVNRLILGDSLVVMNSLLRYEGLGGQVQMIYIDPPYGVKFGSNFQPFVRKRDVRDGDDSDLTREPEMVQAYRDTWQLGLHSYLTYLRDRLVLARDLLTPSGSIFVQISDENLHHVRELMDEVFGVRNVVAAIPFKKTAGQSSELLAGVADYILWYARDATRTKYRQLYLLKDRGSTGSGEYSWVELPNGTRRRLTRAESDDVSLLPPGYRFFIPDNLTSNRPPGNFPVEFDGVTFRPRRGYWKTGIDGMSRLIAKSRVIRQGDTLRYIRYFQDFPVSPLVAFWDDTGARGWGEEKLYAVQTAEKVIERCILMTTDPGDLVLDPTCGSGTTAYVAEQWGRRWITIDTSRVPLALTRQRLLTATFPWYRLRNEEAGPAGGFVYSRRQNRKGEEIGGIVPHITLKSIANDEPPAEEILVDRPDQDDDITRISGPFTLEATLPTPAALDGAEPAPADEPSDHIARMIEVLKRSPRFSLPGNRTITLRNIRRPARSLSLSAEAMLDDDTLGGRTVAILIGPANGPISEKSVLDAAKEANVKGHGALYVIGFAITPEARAAIDAGEDVLGLPALYASATMDLQMGDLLKNQRSSQIFAVCGQPDIEIARLDRNAEDGTPFWQVRLRGFDSFDPVTMKTDHLGGEEVPCWMLDTHYDGMTFHARQVFFPRTSAWDNLRKALKATHDETVWEHLRGAVSAPFAAAIGTDIMVKVLDDRGNELPVLRRLGRAQ